MRNWTATSLATPEGRVTPPQRDDFDSALADGVRLLIGSPATICGYLEPLLEGIKDKPSFYFAPAFQWGDLTYEQARASIRLFAEEVMPAFRSW